MDPHRIAVMGESAGGGHAAMLALTARDRGEYSLTAQVLIYPMLDDRTGSTRGVPAHIGQYGWSRDATKTHITSASTTKEMKPVSSELTVFSISRVAIGDCLGSP